jgi:hypothetical protein
MKDAFGVERADIEKRLRIPLPKLVKEPVPLRDGEFWHGTTHEAADSIHRAGFKLGGGRHGRTTRAGRPRATGMLGPGVYLTKSRPSADIYGNQGRVLRVKVEGPVHSGKKIKTTPQAAKEGFVGTALGQTVAVGNPRKLSVVPEPKPKRRLKWS